MPSSAHPNAVAAVCKIVDAWDMPLVYSVQGGERIKGGETTTMTTLWSRPTRFAPVPSEVVKVHWLLRQRKGTGGKQLQRQHNWKREQQQRQHSGQQATADSSTKIKIINLVRIYIYIYIHIYIY